MLFGRAPDGEAWWCGPMEPDEAPVPWGFRMLELQQMMMTIEHGLKVDRADITWWMTAQVPIVFAGK
jgi:hypothetical protein